MEETPICASVEKDLHITVDELIAGSVPTPREGERKSTESEEDQKPTPS